VKGLRIVLNLDVVWIRHGFTGFQKGFCTPTNPAREASGNQGWKTNFLAISNNR